MASTANAEIGSEIYVSSSYNTSNPRGSSQNFNTPSSMVDENSNPSSPYFLPQPLIGPENYPSWARVVFLSLSGRNKFGFLNGSISMPDPSSPLFNAWHRANTTILSWLTISLSKELVASVIYINTSRDLWLDMENRFSQGNASRLFELKKDIARFSQGQLTVKFLFH